MSSSSSLSPPDRSDDGSAVPSTESSNYTLLYIIIAVLVGVIMYVAIRYGRSVLAGWRQLQAGHGGTPGVFRLGLSVADIAAFPTFTYRARAASASPYGGGSDERRSGGKGRAAAECVVCLQELEDGDVVRVLPACRHFFHDRCIDAWLCAHATCPVCRAHPEPERACLGEPVAVSPPLPQLRQCGASPERPTASRILADILARSPMMSKSPSPRVQFGSRSPSPTPPGYGCRVDDRWTKSPPPGVSEIVIARSKSPSPIRFSRQLSARSIGVLEIMEMTTSASPSPVPIREDGGGSL